MRFFDQVQNNNSTSPINRTCKRQKKVYFKKIYLYKNATGLIFTYNKEQLLNENLLNIA